jgi:hypothetical protein
MAERTKHPQFRPRCHHVVILAVPPVLELDVIGPVTVFSFAAKRERSRDTYRITSASIARLRIWKVRSWIANRRSRSSSSDHRWQVWHARLMFRTGLRM